MTTDLTGGAGRPGPLAAVRSVVPVGVLAGVAAALATEAGAALARAAGVTFEADGTAIPAGAFAFRTTVGAGFGILAALVLRDRNRFVRFGVAGTALSLLPAVVMPDAVTTTLTLAALHVVAALGVVPAIASRLPRGGG